MITQETKPEEIKDQEEFRIRSQACQWSICGSNSEWQQECSTLLSQTIGEAVMIVKESDRETSTIATSGSQHRAR